MAVIHGPAVAGAERDPIARLSYWALLMVPIYAVVFLITDIIGEYVVLDFLGLPEGSLFLMQEGAAGWFFEILFLLILLTAPVVGVWFAARALHHGVKGKAWTALVLNGLLILQALYMFVDAIRMSYFAPLD